MKHIHRRLGVMRGTPDDVPFGGINLITIGDFYQLPPVKADFIFAEFEGQHWPSRNARQDGQSRGQRGRNRPNQGELQVASQVNLSFDCAPIWNCLITLCAHIMCLTYCKC